MNGQLVRQPGVLIIAALICVFAAGPARTAAQEMPHQSNPNLIAGKRIFESTCASCHGLNGRGGERAPDIAKRAEVVRLSDTETLKVLRDGILSKGMPSFSSLGQEKLSEVLSYLRSLQGKGKAPVDAATATEGKKIFAGKGGCSECHMVRGTGGFIGPDLSGYGASHSADDIRNFIVNPDKRPGFRKGLARVTTKEGQQISGLVKNEDNFSVQLLTLDGTFHLLEKSSLSELTFDTTAVMPSDYGSKLSKTELDQLVGYLSSVGDAKR